LTPLGSSLCALPIVVVISCSCAPSHHWCLAAWVAFLTVNQSVIHPHEQWLMRLGVGGVSFVVIGPLCCVVVSILTLCEPPYKQVLIGVGWVSSWYTFLPLPIAISFPPHLPSLLFVSLPLCLLSSPSPAHPACRGSQQQQWWWWWCYPPVIIIVINSSI